MRAKLSCAVVLVLGGVAGSALGGDARVVYSTIVTSPTSDAPGLPGRKFISFDRPNPSQNGRRWITVASVDSGSTTTDNVLLVGNDSSGVIALQEGTTEVEPARTPGSLTGDRRASIRDDGRWAYSVDLSGATTDDRVILSGVGTTFSIQFREGQVVGAISGATFGSTIAEAQILDDGTISVRASLGGLTTATDAALLGSAGSVLLSQEGQTPGGQQVAPDQVINGTSGFGFNTFIRSNDGSVWTVIGSLAGPSTSNSVVLRNNQVLLQEGTALSGLTGTIQQFYGNAVIGGNNDVFVAGWTTSQGTGYFVTRNGNVLAKVGDAVAGGLPGEVWDTSVWNTTSGRGFFVATSDEAGNYVLGGFTSAPVTAGENVVYQYNGETVLLRGGDPVDVDGDGMFDDDAFYTIPASDLTGASLGNKIQDAWLSSDGFFYKVGELRNSAGASLGEAIIRVTVPVACAADLDDGTGTGTPDGGVDINDLLYFLAQFEAGNIAADLDDGSGTGTPDGGVDINDLLFFLTRFEAGC